MAKPKNADVEDGLLGVRIRLLRESRGLSVRALANLAGINPGTLQKVENKQTSPSVSTLKSILQALGTTLGEFFSSLEDEDVEDRHVFRPGELTNLSTVTGVKLLGTPTTRNRSLQVLHETYAPGSGTGKKPLRHSGEDGGVCVSGTMELTLGEERFLLGPGDAFHYRSEVPHRWRNPGKSTAEMITACTPPSF